MNGLPAALVVRDIIDDRGEIRNQIGDFFEPVIKPSNPGWNEKVKARCPGLDVRAALLLIGSDALLHERPDLWVIVSGGRQSDPLIQSAVIFWRP